MSDALTESSGVDSSGVWGDLLDGSGPLVSLNGDAPIASCVVSGTWAFGKHLWPCFFAVCGVMVLAMEGLSTGFRDPSLFPLFVAAILILPLLRRLFPVIIDMISRTRLTAFDDRIEVCRWGRIRSIPWSEIECLQLPQFYVDIPVDTDFQAVARRFGWQLGSWQLPIRRSLTVHARYGGDAEGVIRAMMSHCDYIVQGPAGYVGELKRTRRDKTSHRRASK